MFTSRKWFSFFFYPLIGIMLFCNCTAFAADNIILYTPYTKISVPPGESIDYTIDVINNSGILQNVDISVSGIPKSWNYLLKSGGWTIGQLSILPGERKSLSLKVEIPFQVEKGNYHFRVSAGGSYTLPLVINVSQQGSYKTEFTTDQSNMQGYANSTFTFTTNLKNRTAEKQLYALIANAPIGWIVTFKTNFKQVTSVDINENGFENVTVEINPPDNIESGTYDIPVKATTNTTSATVVLQVVIAGTYNLELTTPTGLLSTSITAGDDKRVDLLVKNTGSTELKDINLSYSAPTNWNVSFDPKTVPQLIPGAETHVFANIKADKKAIAGDYITNIEAKSQEMSAKIVFRVSVKTAMIWGWIGILIIIGALGSVYYLFRKYGRR